MFFWKTSEGGGVISDPKNTLQIFLVSKRYILVVNFGKKCPKRGGGVISNPKNFIANLRKLAHIYKVLQKKRNVISKKGRDGQGRSDFFSKKHQNLRRRSPLICYNEEVLVSVQNTYCMLFMWWIHSVWNTLLLCVTCPFFCSFFRLQLAKYWLFDYLVARKKHG